MCQGSLLSASTIPAYKLSEVGHLRLGAQALHMPVFSLGSAAARRDRSGDEDHDPRRKFVVRCVECPLCGKAPLDVFHLANLCTSPPLVSWRAVVGPSAQDLLVKISKCLETAQEDSGRDISCLCNEVVAETADMDFGTDAGRFILFRLLLFHPWSARIVPATDLAFYPVSVTGELFDMPGVQNRFLRSLANTWGYWSIRWAWRLGHAWRTAHAALASARRTDS